MTPLLLFAHLYIHLQYIAVILPTQPWGLGVQSVVRAPLAMPEGGPQALEGDVILEHDRGTTKLVIGTIGNVFMHARGNTTEIRSMQAGGVFTNDGHVGLWSGLVIARPIAGEGYTGPVHIDDYHDITFSNGWFIRPDGDRLLICRPTGACRDF